MHVNVRRPRVPPAAPGLAVPQSGPNGLAVRQGGHKAYPKPPVPPHPLASLPARMGEVAKGSCRTKALLRIRP